MSEQTVRRAGPQDAEAMVAVAAGSGLFSAAEMDAFAPMIREGAGDGDALWLVTDSLQGVAMVEAEGFADHVWNLRFIAVLPAVRGQGGGRLLLRAAEVAVLEQGARMLLVETDGSAAFTRVRGFYRAAGYDEEARIRDYFGPGQDKVVFRKAF